MILGFIIYIAFGILYAIVARKDLGSSLGTGIIAVFMWPMFVVLTIIVVALERGGYK